MRHIYANYLWRCLMAYSSIPVFICSLNKELENFLQYKRSNGYVYGQTYCSMAKCFDRYLYSLNQENEIVIDDATIDGWLRTCVDKSSATHNKYFDFISEFCKYLSFSGNYDVTVPDPTLRRKRNRCIPYFYSDAEIQALFSYLIEDIQDNPEDLRCKTVFILFCLYYGCGLRKSEALNLKLNDFDEKNRTLLIKMSKNDVTRLIPLSKSLFDQLSIYVKLPNYENENSYIFMASPKKRFTDKMLYQRFHELLMQAEIPRRSDGTRPRIQDLRHLFLCEGVEANGRKRI